MKLRSSFLFLVPLACISVPAPTQSIALQSQQLTPEQIAKMPVKALPIAKMKMLSSSAGWVSTGNRILMTTDSGAHWKDISPPVPNLPNPADEKFVDAFFLNADTGWVLSIDPAVNEEDDDSSSVEENPLDLFFTTDGGAAWTKVNLPSRQRSETDMGMTDRGLVAFADRFHGWVSINIANTMNSTFSELFATSDGGRTWAATKGEVDGTIRALVAVTEKDLWALGTTEFKHDFQISHDGGNSFQVVDLPAPAGIAHFDGGTIYGHPVHTGGLSGFESVIYVDPDHPKSAEVLFATEDGGRTWKWDRMLTNLPDLSGGTVDPYTVAGDVWMHAFGPDGTQAPMLKVRKGNVTEAAGLKLGHHTCDLSFVTSNEGWRNCGGDLSSTTDGGATWAAITPRARNGALTTDPVTPKTNLPLQMKTFHLSGAVEAKPMTVAPGGGIASGLSQRLGFDSTDVLETDAMQNWWNFSPYYDVGIYIPGSKNRHRDKTLTL